MQADRNQTFDYIVISRDKLTLDSALASGSGGNNKKTYNTLSRVYVDVCITKQHFVAVL